MSKSRKVLREERPAFLTIFWCDRCSATINSNENPWYFHFEQCGGCRKFKAIDGDWGYCTSHASVYSGRLMFEHDTCSRSRNQLVIPDITSHHAGRLQVMVAAAQLTTAARQFNCKAH